MERSAFLSSLPWLIPLPSVAWPPSTNTTTTHVPSNVDKTILGLGGRHTPGRSFVLSLETSHGPAFFAAHGSDDPALTAVEVVVLTWGGNKESSPDRNIELSEELTTPQQSRHTTPQGQEQIVCLQVEGTVYAVDLTQCQSIRVVPESYQTDDKKTSQDDNEYSSIRRWPRRPPSLLWQFHSHVGFRFFGETVDVDWRSDKTSLDAVCHAISHIQSTASPTIAWLNEVLVPTRQDTSPGSNNSNGRAAALDAMYTTTAADPSRPGGSGNSSDTVDVSNATTHGAMVTDTVEPMAALHRSAVLWTRLARVLETPVPTDSLSSTRTNDSTVVVPESLRLGPLLTHLADTHAQAYTTATTAVTPKDDAEAALANAHRRLEDTLTAFFPAPHRGRKRPSPSTKTATTTPTMMRTGDGPVDTAVDQLRDVWKEYTKTVNDKHRRLRLPTRG